MSTKKSEVKYIEVKVYDKKEGEKKGLLSHFDEGKNILQLIVGGNDTVVMFSLVFYSITSVVVVLEQYYEEVEEHYMFKNNDEDQLLAKKTIKATLQKLEIEHKANSLGYVNKGVYKDFPSKYEDNKKVKKIDSTTTSTVCDKSNSVNNNTNKDKYKDNISMYPHNNYRKKEKIIDFIPRIGNLPTKADLISMKKMVQEVVTKVYKQKFTDFDKLDTNKIVDITKKDITNAMETTRKHNMYGYHEDAYGPDFRGY